MSFKVETLNLISMLVDELKAPHEPLKEARIVAALGDLCKAYERLI